MAAMTRVGHKFGIRVGPFFLKQGCATLARDGHTVSNHLHTRTKRRQHTCEHEWSAVHRELAMARVGQEMPSKRADRDLMNTCLTCQRQVPFASWGGLLVHRAKHT